MTNKSLSERISEIEKDAKLEIGHAQEATSAQINAHFRGKYRGQVLYARYVLPLIQELQAENQALLAKNGELQEVVKMQGEALKKYSLVGNAHGILYAKEALEKSKQILGE